MKSQGTSTIQDYSGGYKLAALKYQAFMITHDGLANGGCLADSVRDAAYCFLHNQCTKQQLLLLEDLELVTKLLGNTLTSVE